MRIGQGEADSRGPSWSALAFLAVVLCGTPPIGSHLEWPDRQPLVGIGMADGRFEPILGHLRVAKGPKVGVWFLNWISVQDDGELFMKVLIVDDHALIREALHSVLKQLNREAVVLDASNSHQAMCIVEEHPDISLILLDINLPDRDGFSVLRELRERYATIAIVILSSSDDQDTVKRAFKLGALGFIPKTTEREVILSAIKLVFSGGVYIPSQMLEETRSSAYR